MNSCIDISVKRAGDILSFGSERLGDGMSFRSDRSGDVMTATCGRIGEGLSAAVERMGDPMSFSCSLVCTVGNSNIEVFYASDGLFILADGKKLNVLKVSEKDELSE